MYFRKTSFVALLAVVALAFTVPSVQAQDTTGQAPPPPPMPQQTQEVTFESLMAALNDLSAETAELEAATGLSAAGVQVVTVSSLQGADMNALTDAINQNRTDIEALQASLEDNTAITDALMANGAAVSDVIAADVLQGGEVVVFVHQQDM